MKCDDGGRLGLSFDWSGNRGLCRWLLSFLLLYFILLSTQVTGLIDGGIVGTDAGLFERV
jgi:hypothetical protein